MNVQEAVKQTLDIYADSDEYQSIDNAMDYLLQILKADDSEQLAKAVHKAKHPKTEIRDQYMSGYRDGWNDALREIGVTAGSQVISALVNTANALLKK
jgi:type VI protein secretion system component VasK